MGASRVGAPRRGCTCGYRLVCEPGIEKTVAGPHYQSTYREAKGHISPQIELGVERAAYFCLYIIAAVWHFWRRSGDDISTVDYATNENAPGMPVLSNWTTARGPLLPLHLLDLVALGAAGGIDL